MGTTLIGGIHSDLGRECSRSSRRNLEAGTALLGLPETASLRRKELLGQPISDNLQHSCSRFLDRHGSKIGSMSEIAIYQQLSLRPVARWKK